MVRALMVLLVMAAAAEAAPERWLRRAYLDLVGAPPPVDEVTAYLARPDDAARRAVAERLAASPECAERWARILAVPLAPPEDEGGGARKLEEVLARALRDGASWPDTLGALVAPGPAAVAFARPLEDDGTRIAAKIGSGMLGVRLRCARCHDDPVHGWTAAEYFGLAAFYGRPRTLQAPARLVAAHRAGRIRTLYDLVMHLPTMKPRGTDHRWVRASVLRARGLLAQLHGLGVGPMPPNVEGLDWAAYDVYRLHAMRERSGKLGGGFGGTTGVAIPGTVEELRMPRLLLLATAHPTPTRLEPGRPVPPRFPGASVPVRATTKRRELLAEWIRDPENPFTARAVVNRVHAALLGKPLVAPVDEIARPVDHTGAAELEARARAFTERGGRVSGLLTELVLSRPYAGAGTTMPRPVDHSVASGGVASQGGMSAVTATIPLGTFHLTEPEGSGCERYADVTAPAPRGLRILGAAQITAALSAATSHPTTAVTTAVRDVTAALELWAAARDEAAAFPPRMLGGSGALRELCLTAPVLGTLAGLPDDEARVTRLFQITLGRAPDETERGRARSVALPELLLRLVMSAEFLAIP